MGAIRHVDELERQGATVAPAPAADRSSATASARRWRWAATRRRTRRLIQVDRGRQVSRQHRHPRSGRWSLQAGDGGVDVQVGRVTVTARRRRVPPRSGLDPVRWATQSHGTGWGRRGEGARVDAALAREWTTRGIVAHPAPGARLPTAVVVLTRTPRHARAVRINPGGTCT